MINTYLNVRMKEYCYISKKNIPQDISGFCTDNVCECVSGFISSDQGYACFHFYRLNDAKALSAMIKKDFEDATSVKMNIIGANLGTIFLPWKTKDRNLTYDFYKDEEAMAELKKDLYMKCYLLKEDEESFFDILEESRIKINENLFIYNAEVVDRKLKEKKFQVTMNGKCQFIVTGIKDFVAYQNLARVTYELSNNSNIFSNKNTSHFNCFKPQKNGDKEKTVIFDFSGSVTVTDDPPQQRRSLACRKITDIKKYPEFRSLNKQSLLNSYKTKNPI